MFYFFYVLEDYDDLREAPRLAQPGLRTLAALKSHPAIQATVSLTSLCREQVTGGKCVWGVVLVVGMVWVVAGVGGAM